MSLDTDSLRTYTVGTPEMLLMHIGEAGEGDALAERMRGMTGRGFALAAIPVTDWNRDLSPWPAPPVFGQEGFAGQARETLDALLDLLPRLNPNGLPVCLGGYSLAGLFALWAQYVCPAFDAVMAASPSVWFPDWDAFADAHTPFPVVGCNALFFTSRSRRFAIRTGGHWPPWPRYWGETVAGNARRYGGFRTRERYRISCSGPVGPISASPESRAYLSLGLQEPHARNRTLATVGDALRRQHARFEAAGIPARLDWNAGNHFTDPDGRCARGYAWILEECD